MAASMNKPIMLLIHKPWCGACKALKGEFIRSQELVKASQDFVMVNTDEDEHSNNSKYQHVMSLPPSLLKYQLGMAGLATGWCSHRLDGRLVIPWR